MAPITRVLDVDGNVLHDCTRAGCDVSWDGYALRDLDEHAAGERVDNADHPFVERFERVDERTVRRLPRD